MNRLLQATIIGCYIAISCPVTRAQEVAAGSPVVQDERLEISRFASSEQIVTPIGMTIDVDDRLFVIESHTHLPPQGYEGPTSDRIKVFVDANDDGKPDSVEVFADGLSAAMNLAFSPSGDLYVVCAREVVAYRRVAGQLDPKSRWQVLKLETEERYAHNCLLGITFDRSGLLYIARGNTGGRAYRLVGTDGTSVAGYGDGGSVVVCDAAGTNLREFATGFWNPFDLKFTAQNQLLLVDNDPDARGPNRLLQVLDRGDYGYKSLYGGGGNHPFQGWDGTLPGTLPYISGVGEAPSGLIDARQTSFPSDYRDSVLVTVWNENTICRIDIDEIDGELVSPGPTTLVAGGKDFRPVALAADSKGNLFVTDWVLVDYPNHGRGNIWRISTRRSIEDADRLQPRGYFAEQLSSEQRPAPLRERMVDVSPFVRHAATVELAAPENSALRSELQISESALARLGSLLAAKRAEPMNTDLVEAYLFDDDVQVRIAALMWAAETGDSSLSPVVRRSISVSPVTPKLFETWVAALEGLQPKFASDVRQKLAGKSKDLHPVPEDEVLFDLAVDQSLSGTVRAFGLDALSDEWVKRNADRVLSMAESDDPSVATQAMSRLGELYSDGGLALGVKRMARLQQIAELTVADGNLEESRRIAAASLLAKSPKPPWRLMVQSIADESPTLAYFVSRTLRDAASASGEVKLLAASLNERLVENEVWKTLPVATREQLEMAATDSGAAAVSHSRLDDDWIQLASELGDASRGKFVFQSTQLGCARCHSVDGRGALLGPDLGQVAKSKSVAQIVEAIVNPSADFPPQYQAWLVADVDGRVHRGIQMDHKSGGAIEMISEQGELIRLRGPDVDFYKASPMSLMPDGLASQLSDAEFRDLLAYLAAMK
ncbi:MAG: c-type cytochrome [Aureliella sp.]